MIGLSMWREPSIPLLVEQILEAEAIGVPAVWLPSGGTSPDALAVLAAAAARTRTIKLGAAVLPIWGRHPINVAESVLVIAGLAPGRLRIGIGVGRQEVARTFGAQWVAPLQHLREYVHILRTLLHTGEVEFEGAYFTGRAQFPTPMDIPVLAAGLRSGPYRVAGEVADGLLSSLATWSYIQSQCLPALREGATAVGREPPSIVLNVLVCPTTDLLQVRYATREQFSVYTRIPIYAALFHSMGFDVSEGLPDALIDELVVWGDQQQLIEKLRGRLAPPEVSELRVIPVLVGDDKTTSRQRTLEAVAAADPAH